MNKNKLEKPIVIIGTARSGITLLGALLSKHPDLCYLEEPNVIWRYKNTKHWVDEFSPDLATDEVRDYINKVFSTYVEHSGKRRLLEKTPANSLRLPFVREVLPNSKIIHVVRDGRDVAFSVLKKWQLQNAQIKERLDLLCGETDIAMQMRKFRAIPPRDMLWYSIDVFTALKEKAGLPRKYWGPRFAGMQDCRKSMSKLEICATQWQRCVEHVDETKHLIDSDDFFELTFEKLRTQPLSMLKDIFDFCEVDEPENIDALAQSISHPLKREWKPDVDKQNVSLLEKMLGPQLTRYGYI